MSKRLLVPSLKAVVATVFILLLTIGLAGAQSKDAVIPVGSRSLLLGSLTTGSGTAATGATAAPVTAVGPIDCGALTPPVVGYEISKGQDPADVAGFLDDLIADGFSVGTVNIGSGPIPACVDVLVVLGLAHNLALSSPYTAAQGSLLQTWTASGHGLMVLSDWGFLKDSTQALFQAYGYTLLGGSSGVVSDPTDFDPAGPANSWVIYQTDNFASHPILTGVAALELFRSSWFTPTLNALVTADADASPPAMPVMAAFFHVGGCVVLSADSNWVTDYDGAYLKQNNARAARQAVAWLDSCGALAPTPTPTAAQTRSPTPTRNATATATPLVPVTGNSRIYLPLVSNGICPPVVYSNNFEETVGPEWSNTSTDITPTGRRFLGQFGNETVSLALSFLCLASHTSLSLSFDLFIIRSWDGNTTYDPRFGTVGPDIWSLNLQGEPTVWQTTFTNWWQYNYRQAYPGAYPGSDYAAFTGAAEVNSLGYTFWDGNKYADQDSVYHLSFVFPHTASSLAFNFSASGLQSLADESWGIDNIEVIANR